MTLEETSKYAIHAVIRAATREDIEIKLGRLQYSIGKYERLVRATIPIPVREGDKSKFFLLLSFDINSYAASIIEGKVLLQMERYHEVFA